LGISLAEHEERDFEDGEHKIRPLTCVREKDVYVIQSLYGDEGQTVNDKLCRLLFFLGALRDAGATRVSAVIPYLCYARKDRKTKTHDPITSRYVAQLLECVGADRVVTMDVHNLAAFQNAFRIQTVHLEASSAFVSHFTEQSARHDITVVSPDAGGVKRAERLRQALSERLEREVPIAMVEKHRSKGVVSGEMFAGDVKGRLAILVDDLISTGGTLVRAARACHDRGAVAVRAAATHGLLVGNAGQVLADEALQQVVITNTVPPFRLEGTPAERNLTVLDVAPIFARAIRRLHEGGPIEGESLLE
jgi:ribose-phosphate pyrophosphokinase